MINVLPIAAPRGIPALMLLLVICRPAAADPILVTSGRVSLTTSDMAFPLRPGLPCGGYI